MDGEKEMERIKFENKNPIYDMNEKRFDKIENEINKLGERIDCDVKNIEEEFKDIFEKLKEDFNKLKQDYEINKETLLNTIRHLDKLPDVVSELKEAVIRLDANTQNSNDRYSEFKDDIKNIQQKIEKIDDKSKFDFLTWVKNSLLPILITTGITIFLVASKVQGTI